MRLSAIRISIALAVLATGSAAAAEFPGKNRSDQPPRKVIVGTVIEAYWETYPGLPKRLERLLATIDRVAEKSRQEYGRGPDLVVLPEVAVTGEVSGTALKTAVPYPGALEEAFARKARQHHTYLVVPTYLLEDDRKTCSNVAILVGRNGERVGTYRKLHLAVPTGSDSLEAGTTPGKEISVFSCDFGKLGIQICFDMEYDYGWRELERQGAELVVWPTQSPQTAQPAFRALNSGYYIVSSTWRNNATIFEPTGKITAQIKPPEEILVRELDLSYAILPWSSRLQNGAALRKKYGDKVGFRYYEDEDSGIFWSNDPQLPIGKMLRSIGVTESREELQRIEKLYRQAGVPE